LVALYLIRNAIEAMQEIPEGSRQLTVRTLLSSADWVLVTIHDTGYGLSPEAAERLFQPFFTTKPGGMGLGLSVSRSIIEAQSGQLWATPNPDGGASFHFTLPVDRTAHSPCPADHELDAHRLSH
jgi:signal transduction histidine kinase